MQAYNEIDDFLTTVHYYDYGKEKEREYDLDRF